MTNTGIPNYNAPEMFGGWLSSYDESVDLWSAGAVLYFLATGGFHAFDLGCNDEMEAAILRGSFDESNPEFSALNAGCKALIRRLLDVEPAERPPASQALLDTWL